MKQHRETTAWRVQDGAACPIIPDRRRDARQLPQATASAKLVDAAPGDCVCPVPAGPPGPGPGGHALRHHGGGKRLRPFLVLHSARLFGVDDLREPCGWGAAIEVAAHLQPGA